MKRVLAAAALAALAGGPAMAWRVTPPESLDSGVIVRIDLSDQEMQVMEDGKQWYVWPVSTARPGKCTPIGTYHPDLLKRVHYSTLYNNAPMPWSIFFLGNYAIHGTTQVDRLGQVASAGCVRLAPENAENLFNMVRDTGFADTWIVIVD